MNRVTMETITIAKEEKTPTGWQFSVVVGEEGSTTKHEVLLDEAYWKSLTGGNGRPKTLIEHSFVFLLKREPKESILASFNLKQIENYFPEYKEEIASSK